MSTFQSLQEARDYFSHDHFATENGMTLESFTGDGAVCAMTLTERHLNAGGGLEQGAAQAVDKADVAIVVNDAA